MDDTTIVKLVAIASLTVLEVVNLVTAKIDGNVLLTIGALIGCIAGYNIGSRKVKKLKKDLEELVKKAEQ
jgi:membrane protein DedA with SNARE-associated domain